MNNFGLTSRQHDVFAFIKRFNNVYGIFPSVREISLGQIEGQQVIEKSSSTGNIHRLLTKLEERKVIERQTGRARSIRILD